MATDKTKVCNCDKLDDDLIEQGWTCYNCYQDEELMEAVN